MQSCLIIRIGIHKSLVLDQCPINRSDSKTEPADRLPKRKSNNNQEPNWACRAELSRLSVKMLQGQLDDPEQRQKCNFARQAN